MIKNFIISALRNLSRHKSYSMINLAGLSVGLAATILIYTFISHELSFDRFHNNLGRIYRINTLLEMGGEHSIKGPVTMGSMPPVLEESIPEIRYTSRIFNSPVEIHYNNQSFFNNRRLLVDPSFLDIFTFPVIQGENTDPLSQPGSIVITRDLAEKIFKGRSATGETVAVGNRDFMISAVIEDIPSTSHLDFDLLMSFRNLENESEFIENQGFSFNCYFLLEEGIPYHEALKKTGNFINNFYEERLSGMGLKATPFFQPLNRIHLHSEDMQFEMDPRGSITNVYVFGFLAVFILLIAIVNHVNLVTARSETRSREIAVRKIAGSSKLDLVKQFMSESFIITIISLIIAVALAEILVPSFGNLMGRNISLAYLNPRFMLFLVLITLITGTGAGAYPSFYLSGFSPLKIFGKQSVSRPVNLLKIILVVFQFTIAIFLITCLIILYNQTWYMKNVSPGFDRDNVMIVENVTGNISDNYSSVKNELINLPRVINVTASEGIPGNQATVQNSWHIEKSRDDAVMVFENRVQDDYFETYRIPIIKGRSFLSDLETDKSAFVINQSAARALGLQDPPGQDIYVWETRGTIIGVVSDFHFESLHEPIKPIVHSRYSDHFRFMSIRTEQYDIEGTIIAIGKILNKFDPDYIYTYSFLDDRLRGSYQQEERNNTLIAMSAILSVILSVMGLYSLTSFTILRMTKEIGIRKAMGSTTVSLLFMLYRNIGQWVLIANIIAWPASWYVMDRWLNNFAYRAETGIWMFISAGLLALLIAMLTVTGLTLKAARTNPVEALRYE